MAEQAEESKSFTGQEDQKDKREPSPRHVLVSAAPVLFVIVAAIAGGFIWQKNCADRANSLWISGRIEGQETHISAAVPAQVRKVTVGEGDPVHKGQLLILLDDHMLTTKMRDAGSAMLVAESAQTQARHNVNGIRAEAARVKAQPVGLMTKLFGGLVGRKRKEMAKEMEFHMKMAQAEGQIKGAQAQAVKARAVRDQVTSSLSYFRISSPIDGVCSIRSVEEGEMAGPGRILLTIVNTSDTYLRGFVAEGDIGKIRIGDKAKVFLDSAPKEALDATVMAIDPKAAFTPENVYFQKDRVKQVFGVKLKIEKPDGLAKPGMPADAQILLAGRGQQTQ
jgi:multidrug resistance efflux pump